MRTSRTIERYAVAGAHGRRWYSETRGAVAELAAVLYVEPEYLAGVLAITSPRVQVVRNIALTVAYVSRGSTDGMLPGVRVSLAHYEATGEIRGPKTRAFSRALMGDGEAIVLDVWMARALDVTQAQLGAAKVRRAGERRIRSAAVRLGWTPAEVQAAVWTHWVETHRDARGRRPYVEAPSFSDLLRRHL